MHQSKALENKVREVRALNRMFSEMQGGRASSQNGVGTRSNNSLDPKATNPKPPTQRPAAFPVVGPPTAVFSFSRMLASGHLPIRSYISSGKLPYSYIELPFYHSAPLSRWPGRCFPNRALLAPQQADPGRVLRRGPACQWKVHQPVEVLPGTDPIFRPFPVQGVLEYLPRPSSLKRLKVDWKHATLSATHKTPQVLGNVYVAHEWWMVSGMPTGILAAGYSKPGQPS